MTVGLSCSHSPLLQPFFYPPPNPRPGRICPVPPQPQVNQAPISLADTRAVETGKGGMGTVWCQANLCSQVCLSPCCRSIFCYFSYVRSFFCSSQQLSQNHVYLLKSQSTESLPPTSEKKKKERVPQVRTPHSVHTSRMHTAEVATPTSKLVKVKGDAIDHLVGVMVTRQACPGSTRTPHSH